MRGFSSKEEREGNSHSALRVGRRSGIPNDGLTPYFTVVTESELIPCLPYPFTWSASLPSASFMGLDSSHNCGRFVRRVGKVRKRSDIQQQSVSNVSGRNSACHTKT